MGGESDVNFGNNDLLGHQCLGIDKENFCDMNLMKFPEDNRANINIINKISPSEHRSNETQIKFSESSTNFKVVQKMSLEHKEQKS